MPLRNTDVADEFRSSDPDRLDFSANNFNELATCMVFARLLYGTICVLLGARANIAMSRRLIIGLATPGLMFGRQNSIIEATRGL